MTHRASWLTAIVAGLMFVQSVLGLVFPEQYRDVEWIRATWFGNDWTTLIVAVPLLIVGAVVATRGSQRGLLLVLGLIGYAVYNYAYYLFGAALNAFLPIYVVLLVLAVVTLIVAVSAADFHQVSASFRPTTPVRVVGGYFVFVGCGLALVWIGMWAAYVFLGRPTPVTPEVFKLVAALDLALMVPALVIGGILLWRRHALGYLIAAVAGIQASMYLLVLSVSSIVAVRRGLVEAPGEFPLWGTLAVFTTTATLLLVGNSQDSG